MLNIKVKHFVFWWSIFLNNEQETRNVECEWWSWRRRRMEAHFYNNEQGILNEMMKVNGDWSYVEIAFFVIGFYWILNKEQGTRNVECEWWSLRIKFRV